MSGVPDIEASARNRTDMIIAAISAGLILALAGAYLHRG
jgi:hypothetical protein